MEIANMVVGKSSTRINSEITNFEYVIRDKSITRFEKNACSDTLAYIINYPNEEGFAIIASDKRVYPILAYSDKGSFSLSNEVSKVNFIDGIEGYMEKNCSVNTSNIDVDEEELDNCRMIFPTINISLHQDAPYNKFVVKEYPDCPVGCVAVATALVMMHSIPGMNYHDSRFYFTRMREVISNNNGRLNSPQKIVGAGYLNETYTYDQAIDSIAKILYWIGKDVGMNYSPSGSGANSYMAYTLIRHLNFDVVLGYENYNIESMLEYLEDNCIIYMRGTAVSGGGHAWVCDGGSYCISDSTGITNAFIHCDWGWGGVSNGYYSGDVFDAIYYEFEPENYFAVKRHI